MVLPQLQQLQRPFDKLRQLVRKLCHSTQAGVLVPTGPALESLAARVHRAHIAVHAYDLTMEERELGEALQTHSLLVWDTLHAFGQNHFGRLIHFPPSASIQSSTTAATSSGNEPPPNAARLVASLTAAAAASNASSTPGGSSPGGTGVVGGRGVDSPAAAVSGGNSDAPPPPRTANPSNVAPANAAPYAFDPIHHDWKQIESMILHSIACSEGLPALGEHCRSDVAVGVMKHVLRCAQSIRTGLELGVGACLELILPALLELQALVETNTGGDGGDENEEEKEEDSSGAGIKTPIASNANTNTEGSSIDVQLRSKLQSVLPTSPLLAWLASRAGTGTGTGTRTPLSLPPSWSLGSRTAALVEVLQEVVRHAEEESLFSEEQNDDGRMRAVAVVVGDENSARIVESTIHEASDVAAKVCRWVVGSGEGEKSDGGVSTTVSKEQKRGVVEGEDRLAVTLITAEEADTAAGRSFIHSSNEAIWFSAADVLHAAGFDFESAAFGVFCRESAVGQGTDAGAGPECHILATGAQTAAWLEVCRADQLLMAAMQLVQAGDASFEGFLGQLTAGHHVAPTSTTAMSVPPPATILHTLCLGLCGRPPMFTLSSFNQEPGMVTSSTPGAVREARGKTTPTTTTDGHRTEHRRLYEATVVLPDEMLAPGNYALPVSFGSEEILFQGAPKESEAEARDDAAETALSALLQCGLVAAYWQTRALMVQSQQLAASQAATVSLRQLVVSTDTVALPQSPFVSNSSGTGGGGAAAATPGTQHLHAPPVPQDHLICPICGIVTTSEGHLKEHLAGRRHQKNLERLQQQQQMGMGMNPAALAAAAAIAEIDGEKPEKKADGRSSTPPPPSPGPLLPPPLATLSTIDRLPSSLSDAFIRRSSSLLRHPSGNVYEGFPCVRVGDVVLPSSMDLRAFLEEMQQAGEAEGSAGTGSLLSHLGGIGSSVGELLPPIDELQSPVTVNARGLGGLGAGVGAGGAGGAGAGSSSAGDRYDSVSVSSSSARSSNTASTPTTTTTTSNTNSNTSAYATPPRSGRPPMPRSSLMHASQRSFGGSSTGSSSFTSMYGPPHHQQHQQQQLHVQWGGGNTNNNPQRGGGGGGGGNNGGSRHHHSYGVPHQQYTVGGVAMNNQQALLPPQQQQQQQASRFAPHHPHPHPHPSRRPQQQAHEQQQMPMSTQYQIIQQSPPPPSAVHQHHQQQQYAPAMYPAVTAAALQYQAQFMQMGGAPITYVPAMAPYPPPGGMMGVPMSYGTAGGGGVDDGSNGAIPMGPPSPQATGHLVQSQYMGGGYYAMQPQVSPQRHRRHQSSSSSSSSSSWRRYYNNNNPNNGGN